MYRFRLEAVLNHRRHQEEICQKELAQSQRILADEQGKLRQHKREKRASIQKLRAKQKERLNISDIAISLNYIQKLSQNIEDQKNCVREATRKANQKRNKLIIIVKKRKTLEKLEEKERLAYRQKMMQTERKLMDEAASTRHIRQS